MSKHPSAASLDSVAETQKEDAAYFRRLGIPYQSGALLKVLRDRKPLSAMPLACHGLANLGAKEAIPELKLLADFSKADVKATSVLAIARLGGKEETPWLIECLSRKGTDKGYVLWALAATGDPAAHQAVEEWFEPLLRKLERDPAADPRGNCIHCIAFLEQIRESSPKAEELLKRFDRIAPSLESVTRLELGFATNTYRHWGRKGNALAPLGAPERGG